MALVKKCKECKREFVRHKIGVNFCSPICQKVYNQFKKYQAWKKAEEKKERVYWQERKDKLKTHSDYVGELQDLINEIARLIDKGQHCISCQKSTGSQRHGGHRWRTSTYPEIRFHLDNVASQCVYCNDKLSGNPDGYNEGLKIQYGNDYFVWVHDGLKQKYPVLKLTIPELISAKSKARKIIKELKKLDLIYPPKIRIELRKEYNQRLGIYK
jgi:uncharacterized Zn finger protein (UPF0148 family)